MEAEELAEHYLTGVGTRLQHCRGVEEALTGRLKAPEAYKGLGLLHDIGYAQPITGMHAIDGALLLNDTEWAWAAPHIAWHSTALWECTEKDMAQALSMWIKPTPLAHSLLWVADFTTSPTGEHISLAERLEDISSRYTHTHPVMRALNASVPAMRTAFNTVSEHAGHDVSDGYFAAR